MYKELLAMVIHPGQSSIIHHVLVGIYCIGDLAINLTQLDIYLASLSLIAGLIILFRFIYKGKSQKQKLFSAYLALIIVLSFIMFSFLPGGFYLQYGEQLYPITFIILALFIDDLWESKVFTIRSISIIFVLIFCASNIYSFKTNILSSRKEYYYENKICSIAKAPHNKIYSFDLTDTQSEYWNTPQFILYVCNNSLGINTSKINNGKFYHFKTDWINNLTYTITEKSS